ncbi:MAG: ABC transporter ATP-binding protein [Alphaproteobacteria bacterium]|nr:ABC transporter ATP-binding protein [Alphaproteobacteria bacterium]
MKGNIGEAGGGGVTHAEDNCALPSKTLFQKMKEELQFIGGKKTVEDDKKSESYSRFKLANQLYKDIDQRKGLWAAAGITVAVAALEGAGTPLAMHALTDYAVNDLPSGTLNPTSTAKIFGLIGGAFATFSALWIGKEKLVRSIGNKFSNKLFNNLTARVLGKDNQFFNEKQQGEITHDLREIKGNSEGLIGDAVSSLDTAVMVVFSSLVMAKLGGIYAAAGAAYSAGMISYSVLRSKYMQKYNNNAQEAEGGVFTNVSNVLNNIKTVLRSGQADAELQISSENVEHGVAANNKVINAELKNEFATNVVGGLLFAGAVATAAVYSWWV